MSHAGAGAAALLLLALAACRGEDHTPLPPDAASPRPPAAPPEAPAGPPRSLVVIMAELESRMADAAGGLWREDYPAIERAALGIASHAEIDPAEVARMKATLGARFEDFEAGDRGVHDGARLLAEAARRRDLPAASRHFEAVQESCVGCHSAVRAQVRAGTPP